MTATQRERAASRLSMNSTIGPTAEAEWGSCRSRPLLPRWRAEDTGLAVTAPFPGRNQRTGTSSGLGRRGPGLGNSEHGCEGRVPCAVSDLVGVGTADDGTTCGADRDAIAHQIGRGTGP